MTVRGAGEARHRGFGGKRRQRVHYVNPFGGAVDNEATAGGFEGGVDLTLFVGCLTDPADTVSAIRPEIVDFILFVGSLTGLGR